MSKLKLNHLVARAATLSEKRRERVIGIRSEDAWLGPIENIVNGTKYVVRQCDSPLAIRQLLHEQTPDAINLFITNLDEKRIGLDVMLRLAKSRLLKIDHWQIVKDSFHARSIDPRISKHSWIADLLIDIKPHTGFLPVAGGCLDAETVWPLLLESRLNMRSDSFDLQTILDWSSNAEHVRLWNACSNEFQEAAAQWLSTAAGPTAELILNTIAKNESPDALPIGLVLDVLLNPTHSHELGTSLVRLELKYLKEDSTRSNLLQQWAAAAKNVVYFQLADKPQELKQVLSRADAILHIVEAQAMAFLSDISPLGLNQRLMRFGDALSNRIDQRAYSISEDLNNRCQAIFEHMLARSEPTRLNRVKMSVRLLRWLAEEQQHPASFGSFQEAADYQLAEGSYLDWARLSINTIEESRELSSAFTKLFDAVSKIRDQQAEQFAKLLSEWTELNKTSDEYPGVEEVLSKVLTPLAQQKPVLMIVMDGMSTAIFRELIADISKRGWYWLVEQNRRRLSGGLAAIPSITERSRTSLLCGKLLKGNADTETREFAKHPDLLSCSKPGSPPRLFHKSDLTPGNEADLSDTVRNSIQDKKQKIISVVVNAIDDHLEKSQQLAISWTRDAITVLPLLLHEAKLAGRTVILASDHGHIIECNTTYQAAQDGGERWRPAEGEVNKGEIRIQGNRVVNDNHEVIVPWTDSIRYTTGKKNGYHGGVNPQEIVFPIAVLSPSEDFPDGWVEAPAEDPLWWSEQCYQPSMTDQEERPPVVVENLLFEIHDKNKKPASKKNRGSEPANMSDRKISSEQSTGNPIEVAPWIQELINSPILKSQRKLISRGNVNDELLQNVLSAIDGQGGKITAPALARLVSMPATRVRGLVSTLSRILNVDAYEILVFDAADNTVKLNKEMLLKQFGLS